MSKTDKGSIATVLSAFSRAARIAGVTELREGTQTGVEAVTKEGERTGITDATTEQFKDVVDMLPTQAPSLDLRLPDNVATGGTASVTPTAPVSRSLWVDLLQTKILQQEQFARQQPNIDEEISRLMRRA